MTEQRDRIEARTGRSANVAWLLRLDHQVAELFGSATYLLDAHGDLVEDAQSRGDELGLHVHAWRRDGRGGWIDAFGDRGRTLECVEVFEISEYAAPLDEAARQRLFDPG